MLMCWSYVAYLLYSQMRLPATSGAGHEKILPEGVNKKGSYKFLCFRGGFCN